MDDCCTRSSNLAMNKRSLDNSDHRRLYTVTMIEFKLAMSVQMRVIKLAADKRIVAFVPTNLVSRGIGLQLACTFIVARCWQGHFSLRYGICTRYLRA